MLGVRGRGAVGTWVPREEEQEVKHTEWFYDFRHLAPRDQWYRIGLIVTSRERAIAALVRMASYFHSTPAHR